MSDALIIRDDARLSVAIADSAEHAKAAALEGAALIGRVTNATEQDGAVEAQKSLARLLKLVEDARKAVKDPVLAFGRKIDDTARQFVLEIKEEELRIAKLVGDFQQLQIAKARAAEALRLKELQEIERRKQEELAKANSHEELDAIHARANEEAAAVPVQQFAKSAGQVVKEDWEFTVHDVWALARVHPHCVTIEPRRSEIKQLLNAGVMPAGVAAKKVVVSNVRLSREREAITA